MVERMNQVNKPEDGDVEKASTRTVDALQRVYAIVIALALTTAVKLLIEILGITQGSGSAGRDVASATLLFIAFLFTLVVFYHGMNRHLDDTFVTGESKLQRPILLLVDIFVFLVEGSLLVVMASTINNPGAFFYAWSVLLVVDILWGLYLYLVIRRVAPSKWILNNTIFLAVAWVLWLLILPQNVAMIAIVEIMRNIVDYRINWAFYFPNRRQ